MTFRLKKIFLCLFINLISLHMGHSAYGMEDIPQFDSRRPLQKALIRKKLSHALSDMFGREVPEYKQFTSIVRDSNEEFLKQNPTASIDCEDRVLAEKHGAIRVGTAFEMTTVTRIFAALGMEPVEFYDLTQLPNKPLPMIATAFRPTDQTINVCAFRMFCSMLHPDYIPDNCRLSVMEALQHRQQNNSKFSPLLMELLHIAETSRLKDIQEDEFVAEVVNAFKINSKPINFTLYKQLRSIHDVFADIICLGINLNHLTPRAYDIQDAANRLIEAGVPMKIGGIEGPPIRQSAPSLQLNQTSRIAPGEPIFVTKDDSILLMAENDPLAFEILKTKAIYIALGSGESVQDYLTRVDEELSVHNMIIIQHKARFGEIESRGTALTPKGESLMNTLLAENAFETQFPKTHEELYFQGLAYYTFGLTDVKPTFTSTGTEDSLDALITQGIVKLIPQTYDDFLAASAAGIFTSNLTSGTQQIQAPLQSHPSENKPILETAMKKRIGNRHNFHEKEQQESALRIYPL